MLPTNKDSFWIGLEKTLTVYSPDKPVIIQRKKIAEHAKDMQKEMFGDCVSIDSFVQESISNSPKKVLDLGSGVGANTILLAKSGACVTAIDQSQKLLTTLLENSAKVNCLSHNLCLHCSDITEIESYEGPFDVVIAIDILPYLPPTTLRSTMEKIHNCLENNGVLIGSIFTNDTPSNARKLGEQLGAHYYKKGSRFVITFLQKSGFEIIKLEETDAKGRYHFIAKKMSINKS